MHHAPLATAVLALLALAACGQAKQEETEPTTSADETAAATEEATPADVDIYAAAVANPARPAADRERDASRKPAEVLEFFGIEPGMTVVDLFTGGGYYAELIAHIVGSEGKVIAHTNAAYLNFVGDAFAERFDSGRRDNVEVLMAENNELDLEPDSVDAVMLVLSFHDLYYVDEENGWPAFDRPAFLAELRDGLRPGGIVALIDHAGEPGMPAAESAASVHRIDPAIVRADMAAAGFELVAESDLLRNPDDDYAESVFAGGRRGTTDRFVMCFSSPD